MPRIMTVDDSRSVRTIVAKQMAGLGFDIDEAEDGQQALDKLEDVAVDLILLDVTMPVMDGPTMLAKLRGGGNQTPVIMLTSESKRSVVGEAMKLGIEDYILKPFKPEELLAKVRAALKLGAAPAAAAVVPQVASMAAAPPPPAPGMPEEATGAKQFVDILVVDDMENVAKKLRSMIPAHVTLGSCTSAQAALTLCRDRIYRVVLIDAEIPDVDSAVLAGQIRVLQPHAAVLGLALRSANDVAAELKARGFSDALIKPFTAESVEDFLLAYFDKQELLTQEDNVITVGEFIGRQERLERYFNRLMQLFPPALDRVAAACFEEAVIDLTKVLAQPDRLPKLVIDVAGKAQGIGLNLRLVGTPAVKKLLQSFEETAKFPYHTTVAEAKAQAV